MSRWPCAAQIVPPIQDQVYVKYSFPESPEYDIIVPQLNEDTHMKWSNNQQNIFNWFKDAAQPLMQVVPRALVVEAVAGSGKTTTIAEAAKYIPIDQASVFLAFNKSIATELGKKLPNNVESRTLNSLGHRAVMGKFGKVALDTSKTIKIVRELPDECGIDGMNYIAKYFPGDICNLVGKAKAHGLVPFDTMNGELADYNTIMELKDHYNVFSECPDDVLCDFVIGALKASILQTDVIDFDDQLYFVVAFDLPVPQYSWIIVDEAQDLSHINREMLKKFLATTGKLIAVGDSRQAIYGFRGADSSSLDRIRSEFNADLLPLDTTYRCPKKVVERAQVYVPEINCPDTAPEGTVEILDKFEITDFVNEDLIVCRNTAPLISSAYRMIRHGLPVRVLGREIGKGLTSLIKKISGKKFQRMTMGNFEKKLNSWMIKQIDIAKRRDQEDRIEGIQDKVESLFAIISGSNVETLPEMCTIIDDLFAGNRGPKFATVHKAKGLEAERVFILDPQLMPSPWANLPWQQTQENNLIYVAITRSLDTLFYIDSKRLM